MSPIGLQLLMWWFLECCRETWQLSVCARQPSHRSHNPRRGRTGQQLLTAPYVRTHSGPAAADVSAGQGIVWTKLPDGREVRSQGAKGILPDFAEIGQRTRQRREGGGVEDEIEVSDEERFCSN